MLLKRYPLSARNEKAADENLERLFVVIDTKLLDTDCVLVLYPDLDDSTGIPAFIRISWVVFSFIDNESGRFQTPLESEGRDLDFHHVTSLVVGI